MAQQGYMMVFLLTFCVLCINLVSVAEASFRVVPRPSGGRLATVDDVILHVDDVLAQMDAVCGEYCIARLADGRLHGSGYSESRRIEPIDPNHEEEHEVIIESGCFQPGVDFHGGDVGGSMCSYGAESAEECQDFCLDSYECSFFTYVPAGPLSDRACCWLKAETGWTMKENSGVISGPKYCDDDEYGSGEYVSGEYGSGSGLWIRDPQFENKIRLADSTETSSDGQALRGRLEIYYQGEWGTVCNDDFTDNEAQVACRQLGLTGGEAFNLYDDNNIAEGTGPIWLDDVSCSSYEPFVLVTKDIGSCNHNGFGQHDCGHFEDVGVACIYNGLLYY